TKTMNSKQLGTFGEKIAENYLRKKGYQILDKNYSFRIPKNFQKGEIDIIAKKSDIISFIEVKTLKTSRDWSSAISPEEKVNFSKQRKLIKTAESWLMKKKIPLNSKWQIDVISIKLNSDFKRAKIHHFKNIGF
ncbi:MAG: YraN family protein, partial [Patescibacteria group bacterium]|nr:YraN family protein [Patescibacteria group bacterium]